MTSADSRSAAASKEMRVRVESSKKRLTTVRPRRVGSFLIGRSATQGHLLGGVEDQDGVVAGEVGGRDEVTLHLGFSGWLEGFQACGRAEGRRTSPERAYGSVPATARPRGGLLDAEQHGVAAVLPGELDLDRLPQRRGEVLADVVRADGEFPVAAVDEDRELHRARAADVAERVEGGADRAAGEEHVVDQDDQAALDPLAGDVGAGQGARRAQPQVVAVHGDVERSDRRLPAGDLFEFVGEPTGEEHAPGRDAEQHHVVGALGASRRSRGRYGSAHGRCRGPRERGAPRCRCRRAVRP